MQQVAPSRFKALRRSFRVPGMWGKFVPKWDLLKAHLYNYGLASILGMSLQTTWLSTEVASLGMGFQMPLVPSGIKRLGQPGRLTKWWWSNYVRKGPVISFPEEQDILRQVLGVARRDATLVELHYRKHLINTVEELGGTKRQKKGPQADVTCPSDQAEPTGSWGSLQLQHWHGPWVLLWLHPSLFSFIEENWEPGNFDLTLSVCRTDTSHLSFAGDNSFVCGCCLLVGWFLVLLLLVSSLFPACVPEF